MHIVVTNLQLEEVQHATKCLKQLCIHALSPFKGPRTQNPFFLLFKSSSSYTADLASAKLNMLGQSRPAERTVLDCAPVRHSLPGKYRQ